MGAGWIKMRLWAGLVVPDMVGVACMVLSRPVLTRDGVFTLGSGGKPVWVGSEDADGAAPYMIGLRPKASSTSIAQSSCGGVGDVL